MAMRVCNKCGIMLPLSEFHKDVKGKDGYRQVCKYCRSLSIPNKKIKKECVGCKKEFITEQYKSDKVYCSKECRIYYTKYGIGIDSVEEIKSFSKGKCYICNEEKELVVDHCHFKGEVRGALCSQCNTALGLFKDDVEVMRKAIDYLIGEKIDGLIELRERISDRQEIDKVKVRK